MKGAFIKIIYIVIILLALFVEEGICRGGRGGGSRGGRRGRYGGGGGGSGFGGASAGEIVGIVLGIIAGLAVFIGVLVCCCICCKRTSSANVRNEGTVYNIPTTSVTNAQPLHMGEPITELDNKWAPPVYSEVAESKFNTKNEIKEGEYKGTLDYYRTPTWTESHEHTDVERTNMHKYAFSTV